jgi:hypothetical protein
MFRSLLRPRAEAIAARWFADGVAAYAPEASTLFAGQSDPFANPVGQGLRAGTRAVLDALVDGGDDQAIRASFDGIMAVRAVQQLPPSRALAFVFALKGAVRAELDDAGRDARAQPALAELDARIDEIALLAFDAYVACRERVAELRIQELKRTIPWAVSRGGPLVQIGEPG